MRRLFLLLSLLPLACSNAEPDASEASENGVKTSDAICHAPPTLHRLTKPNASYYDVFANEADARAGIAPILDAVGMQLSATPAPDAVKQIVATQFAAYQALYPEHTEGLTTPPLVFLIENPNAGAFALSDPRKSKVFPWVFFIHTGMLAAPEVVQNPGVLESTIAHELGHLILKNIFSRDAYVFYSEAGRFGFQEKNDASIAAAYRTYQATAQRMGRLYVPELGSFFFHLGNNPDPTYAGYLKLIASSLGGQPPAECGSSDAASTELQAIVDRHLNKSDLTLPLGGDAEHTATLAKQWESDTRTCLGSVKGSLSDLIAAARKDLSAQGATPEQLDGLAPELDEADKAIDAAKPDAPAVDRLFAMASARRASIAAIVGARSPAYASLRFFTDEEEADDASVRVVLRTGVKLDMLLNPYSPTYRDECTALLASGRSPEYGGLVDAHHALCWRYGHVKDLAKTISAACPP